LPDTAAVLSDEAAKAGAGEMASAYKGALSLKPIEDGHTGEHSKGFVVVKGGE